LVLQGIRDHVSFSGKARKRTNSAGAMRVTLSTASVDELAQLPGIGPARARAIVENRRRNGPFKSVEALKRVNGIGPATIERIRRFVAP
jgi:comEA protein